jgi:hypothetical protein
MQDSGPYLNRSMAHHKMAIRCLSFFQFACFEDDLDEDGIAVHIKRGDYLWLEYAESYWLEHVRAASKVDPVHLPQLDESLTKFLVRWRRQGETTTLNFGRDFGFTSFKNRSPYSYETLNQAAMYKSHGKESGTGEGRVQTYLLVMTRH